MTLPKKRGRKPDTAKATKPVVSAVKKKLETPETLKGFKDILPIDMPYWDFIREKAYKIASDYSFDMIETPVLESVALFKRGLGKNTDIIEKEMFEFVDKGGDAVTMRPEGTAGVARSYINHGMHNLPQPVKLFYDQPMFRYENPQAGRFREHHQIGFEIFGAVGSAADAQLILIGHNILKELGLTFSLEINSLGCATCREVFKEALIEYYKPLRKNLCENCKKRLTKNPLRLLDCKEEQCQEYKEAAPHIVDYLDEDCKKHFVQTLEILDELDISYNLNPFLVRGLDYYTKTVFEFWPLGEVKAQSSLLNGGRYDNLVSDLGGLPTAGTGFGMGLERVILRMKEEGVVIPQKTRPDVYVAHLGMEAKKKAMIIFEELRKDGLIVAENFTKDSLKQQLENANKLKARFTLILGQKELLEQEIIFRDMDSGVQEKLNLKKFREDLHNKIRIAKEKEVELNSIDNK